MLLGPGADGSFVGARWVKTAMGQAMADAVGFPEPSLSEEESAKGVLEQVSSPHREMSGRVMANRVMEQIDHLTPEKSGQFLAWNGMSLPW